MKILGIEWSSFKRTIAIGDWSPQYGVRVLAEATLPDGRDSKYFNAFETAAKETGIDKKDIQVVVVGLGPGSYAGIRSAISAAYGWRLANQAKLIGISSDRLIARKVFTQNGTDQVHVLIDAQRGECYHSVFQKQQDDSIRTVQPLSIVKPGQLPQPESSSTVFAGMDVARWFSEAERPQSSLLECAPDASALIVESESLLNQPGSTTLAPVYLRPTSFAKAPLPIISLIEDTSGGDRI